MRECGFKFLGATYYFDNMVVYTTYGCWKLRYSPQRDELYRIGTKSEILQHSKVLKAYKEYLVDAIFLGDTNVSKD